MHCISLCEDKTIREKLFSKVKGKYDGLLLDKDSRIYKVLQEANMLY